MLLLRVIPEGERPGDHDEPVGVAGVTSSHPFRGGLPPSQKEAYTDIWVGAQYPRSGFPLQGLEFGPVQPYGLIEAQAQPLHTRKWSPETAA